MLDHINNDPTDNRLCNLRPANYTLNINNCPRRLRGRARKSGKKWESLMTYRKKYYYLGRYPTEEMARLISRGVKKYIMLFEEAML